ncbi:MAG: DUF362 domain-containing protein [Clostridia bacterium]|nr:DUF362 domain-containing protein [Clostridia bacterium]
MEKVSLIKCDDYIQENVDNAVRQAINNLGGIEAFVKAGQVVVLKANLVMKCNVEKAATTHPSIVEAIGKMCLEAGASKVIIADSAGGPFTEGYMGGIYKACGMKEIADKNGFLLNDNFNSFEAHLPTAKVGKKFLVLDCLQQADVIINVTKLKTHSFTGITNAIKNMFGAIPGLTKVEMHGQFRTLDVFGDFLFDIQDYFKDKLVLHLTDAVIGMEGAGPSNGTPRKIGAIIAGSNCVAVDVVGAKLMNLEPLSMPNIETGINRGYLDNEANIEVLGDNINELVVKDYKTVMPNNYKPFATVVPQWLQPVVHKLTTQRPTVNRKKCKGCKKCFEHCPVQAITMTPTKKGGIGKAKFDYNKCIRCYCCQELCPFGLVKIKSGIVYKILHVGSRKKIKK